MTHRSESILSAVNTALTGLATTGANVQRFRAWPVTTLPALTILKGGDQVANGDSGMDVITREMIITIRAAVKGAGVLETSLNQIAAEIFAALKADYTLGLAYVYDLALLSESEPAIDEQDEPVAYQDSMYQITYEHSETSAEA